MRMVVYLARRLLLLVPVVIGVITITFLLVNSLPIQERLSTEFGTPGMRDPWIYHPTEPCPAPKTYEQCYNPTYYHYLNLSGFNKPVPVQWVIYLEHIFTGQWGYVGNASTVSNTIPGVGGEPVTTVLGWLLPYTLELAALSMVLLLAIALPLGRYAAAHRNEPVDHAARALSFAGFALPTYLFGSIVLTIAVIAVGANTGYFAHPPWCPGGEVTYQEFTGSWPTFLCFPHAQYPSWIVNGVYTTPTGFPTVDAFLNGAPWLGVDSLLRLLLPALMIAFAHLGLILRYVRNSNLEVLGQEYVRAARSEGIPEARVRSRYAGRNSMTVTVTVIGVSFATFFGWFPVAEYLFNLNGVGLVVALAAQGNGGGIDYGVITGATLVLTLLVVLSSILADLIVAYLDPRIRLG